MHTQRSVTSQRGDPPRSNRKYRRRKRLLGSVAVPAVVAVVLLLAPAVGARGPNSPVLVTTAQVVESESSGTPIQVDAGTWLLFRTGQLVTDGQAAVLDTITLEIILDGEALAVETAIEDTAEGTALSGYATSPPLSAGSLHTVTYRQTASEDGQDGFDNSWQAGVIFESTGTVVAGDAPIADPFVGGWLGTDLDGSQQALFIDEPVDGVYLVEYYDHGASICGEPGSRTPLSPPIDEVPTEPGRIAGLGDRDETGALAWDFAAIFCLDSILGPYRVLQSDVDPATPEEEDMPLSGSQRLIYDPTSDTLQNEGDDAVYDRTRATSIEELRRLLETQN